LTNFDFLDRIAGDLVSLNASSNKIICDEEENDLTDFFAPHLSLEKLNISNNPLSIDLKSLRYCFRLKTLKIENIQMATGLGYLPESLW